MLLLIKIVRKCKIVCLCREGLEDFDDPLIVDKRLGGYTFSDKIIDYIFYWGEKPRKIMGNAMIKKHQISSFDRVGISGYIMYNWEVIGRQYTGEELARIESFCSNFSRNALFVTAFFFPEDPIEDAKIYHLFPIHGTPEEKKEYSEFLINKKNRNVAYAKRYLQNIIDYALNHKDVGLLVKLHPVEISEGNMEITKIYEKMKQINNIYIISEFVPLFLLLKNMFVMFHYGSTTAIEAYLNDVPVVYVDGNKEFGTK